MKKTIYLLVLLIWACNSEPKNNCSVFEKDVFWKFKYVYEVVDKSDESITYEFDETILTSIDRKSILQILSKKKIEYIISSDSSIFINRQQVPNTYDMYLITLELNEYLQKPKTFTRYK